MKIDAKCFWISNFSIRITSSHCSHRFVFCQNTFVFLSRCCIMIKIIHTICLAIIKGVAFGFDKFLRIICRNGCDKSWKQWKFILNKYFVRKMLIIATKSFTYSVLWYLLNKLASDSLVGRSWKSFNFRCCLSTNLSKTT